MKETAPLELPLVYEIPNYLSREVLSEELVEGAIRPWHNGQQVPHVPGWSSDWTRFKNVHHWMLQFPRWGLLDRLYDYENLICARVRLRLGTLADIIPVMYDEDNHFRVIFRIANRIYYCKSKRRLDVAGDGDDDFDGVPYPDILGILPITYSQFMESDAQTITDTISDFRSQRNICSNDTTHADLDNLCRIFIYITIKDALLKQYGRYQIGRAHV